MQKFMEVLESKMAPLAMKLDSNRYITAIKDGFFGVMSLLIIGSFFLLLANLPITGYPEFMASLLGDNWKTYFTVPYDVTMNIMTIYVVIAMARSLANTYKLDSIMCITSVVVAFLLLTPTLEFKDGGFGIPTANLSASGLFLGMLTTILSVEIVRFVVKKGWTIKLPDSVPENVSRSFSALIPGLFVIIVFNIIRILFSLTSFGTVQAFVFHYLQVPLLSLGDTLPAILISTIFEGTLWSFGIHGSNVISGIMKPIWLTLTADNASAFAAGEALPHIINFQFYSNFIKVGGFGGTLGLAFLLLLRSKSSQFKALGKLSIAPGFFGINEPIIFGIPIVLNPVLIIPFILTPLVLCVVAYFAMSSGLVPYTNGTNIPWTTPPVIAGFLVSGWKGALLNVVQIFISAAIYYPFFKSADRLAYKLEQQQQQQPELQEKTTMSVS
ncbi:oligo-beta-mannoside permease IIC protein [Bacillus canaveralius]|uniref:Permease IIC component n=1 Tax=Bacillus canaveralius TaxID=1403243 RepID=A0A2N5GFN8_9BACI|nr:PTS sugar transporter subunit IIC [Bacillus canaveralius]PLR79578.1 oligo-beta-mannoside permease IIC protein [Bacillus canaveralius]PLR98288.1 oligo-beta-mannoside permease IIC protein [Bacillus canaveralius]